MSELNDLYQEVILDHNRRPHNFRVIDPASAKQEGFNPLCGDRLTLYLTLDGDPKIVTLNTNCAVFNVSIRTDATIEVTLENPNDSVAPNTYRTPVGPAPVWLTAPVPVNGVTVLKDPVSAVRLTGGTSATILQQGTV